jgi:glycosyltransferase involved in cell wall biosynthesis
LTDYFFSYGINSNDFLFRHDVQKSKIVSFLNAFDSDRFKRINAKKFLDNDKYFLFVGRISKEKNIDFLLDLAKVFKNNSSAIKIKIIGNGPDFNYFKLKAISNHLSNIEFLGSIKWDFLGDYYVNSLGLILPSLFEPWGMVANEAFFYKIPVVCSNFCGCAGDLVIDQFNGIVIDDLSVLNFESSANDFLGNFLSLKNNFTDNIEKTNNIFEPERLSFEHYRSFKNMVC